MPQNPSSNGLKVALVGDSKVGKSTILSRLLGDSFSPLYVQTKERVIKSKYVEVTGERPQKLQIWDTAGDGDYRTIAAYSIKDVQGIIVVFDVCEEDSYMHVQNWMSVIQNTIEHADSIVIVIAANKIDKIKTRKIQPEQIEQLAHQYSVKYVEVSAKSDDNIDKLFKLVAFELHKKAVEQSSYKRNEDESEDDTDSIESKKSKFSCILL
ncbi:ras-related protein Rab-13 [Exaiptasia diaphana]|uniref:Uncharacterized protein n=1 Tax=Exaiptasia diaphana TaxID=2652724 RepID=A0A913Y9Q3_EXADI|nr:ras-related protein Rab-13 [Exaiptasia diaphana]KXJ21688.1 Ras-related protein Rab-13 [Exaiptasia diaphana]